MDLEPTLLAYAAGVIDSDGYIGIKRNDYGMRVRGDATQPVYSARVVVKQVTPQAVTLLHELFGGSLLPAKASLRKGRPLFSWDIHSAAAGRACRAILPYLRIKREQASNAVEVCDINTEPHRRRWTLPAVVEGEPMVTMAEAARILGKSYDVVHQAVDHGSVPHVRAGPRKVLIPESYLPIWAERRQTPTRNPEVTNRLHQCFLRGKELNRVGI